MRNVRLARRYAKALMKAAEGSVALANLRAGLEELSGLYAASAEFREFAEDPTIPPHVKRDLFHQILESRLDPLLLSFLDLLVERQRERALDAILSETLRMLDDREGIQTAEVTSAVPLETGHRQALADALSRATGKNIRLTTNINPELLAGFVIRIGDVTYDASFATQLKRLHHALAAG